MAKFIVSLIAFLVISNAYADETKTEPTVIASNVTQKSEPALPSLGDEPIEAKNDTSPALRAIVFIGAAALTYYVIKDANDHSGDIASVTTP